MYKLISWLGLTLAVFVIAQPTATQANSLDAYLESVRTKYELPAIAAAVTQDGEIIAAGAVGTRVQGKDLPVTLQDRFHIGSDTKAFTATLAGMMVDEGKLRWDSTVGEVLGPDIANLTPKLAAVTLPELLSHSSGIPSDKDAKELLDIYFNLDAFEFNLDTLRRMAVDAWKENEPKVPEGSPFQYSNFGYLIAGAMVEKAAGKPWEELIHERIFQPLGLETAGLGAQASLGKLDAPVGHRIDDSTGAVTPMLWGAAADIPPILGPAGSVHMSILDFAAWAAWNAARGERAPKLVMPETLAEIHRVHVETPHREDPPPGTPQDGSYGLGWGIVEFDWAGKPLLTHNGSNSMNLAKILVDQDADLGIVVTTNLPGRRADAAASEVLQHLYGEYSLN